MGEYKQKGNEKAKMGGKVHGRKDKEEDGRIGGMIKRRKNRKVISALHTHFNWQLQTIVQ